MGEGKAIVLSDYKKSSMKKLMEEVLTKSQSPKDYYEIAAILESFGWNDIRASEAFGVEDVFELSSLIWDMIQKKTYSKPFTEEKKDGLVFHIMIIIKSFLRGIIFSLPMAISVMAMLTLRFSLWSYEYLSTELATSIAIGTILSFVTVGGFMQAMARRGFFFISQGFYNMAKRSIFYLVKLGYAVSIIVAIILLVFNSFYYNFPYNMLIITVVYYLFLCSNWLSVTIMYILRKEIIFTALITAGILVVFILFKIVKLNIIVSQVIALIFISILGLFLVIYFFNKSEEKMEKGIAPSMPRKSITLYLLTPYFMYGCVYFIFLFIDRVIAWSTNNMNMPYIIWFRGDYELGLDFALLMLIVPMGVGEVAVTRLMENLEAVQKNGLSHEIGSLNRKYIKLYLNSMFFVSISSMISAVSVYIVDILINSNSGMLIHTGYLYNHTTYFVFVWGLVAYSILVLALTNSITLFSLSQPNMVTKVLLFSILVNFISGFLLSRWVDYSYAVFGLLLGSIVYAAATSYYTIKVLNNLDYYIYAAL